MNNDQNAPGTFQQSFALFDADQRLVDWDEGFAREWYLVGPALKVGATYGDLLRAAIKGPDVRKFIADNFAMDDIEAYIQGRIDSLGASRSQDYRTPSSRTVHVEEEPTQAGGVRRLARDITGEKLAEGALVEARRRLNAADVGAASVFVRVRRNPDGTYEFPPVDEAMRAFLSFPPEFLGADAMVVHARMKQSPKEIAQTTAILEHSARTLGVCSLEFQILDGLDRWRWVRESLMPHREADGAVIFSGAIRDITREKEAEDQLEILRSVVVRSSDSIVVFETSGAPEPATRILYVNARFTELFGGSPETLIGQAGSVLRPAASNGEGADLMRAALRRGDRAPVEFEARGAGGRLFWVEARAEILQTFENGSYRWVVISRDISDRRRDREELLRAKDAAEAGSRAKGQFLANISHELRTPLNVIIGFTEVIEKGVARGGWIDAYAEYLGDISASGRHLLDLINTVLDLSKIEAGSMELEIAPVDLEDLVRTSLLMMAGLAQDGGVTLSLETGAAGLEVPADCVKLKQILLNLLSNAIKFTPAGGKVTISIGETEAGAVITVADSGCGISAADLRRVTLPFVQVENSLARRFPGTGLGLAIARQLCDLHGGSLEIESVEGEGTTVRVFLPRQSP